MNELAPSKQRLYYLDWLKVLAIALVIVGHSAMPFQTVPGMWLVQDVQSNVLFTLYVAFAYPWMMPLFFFLSGAGAYFALARRNPNKYLSERFVRLLVPLVACTLIFIPFQEFLVTRTMNQYKGTFLQFLPLWPDICTRNYPALLIRFDCYVRHLWFLGFLFVYAVVTLPLLWWLKRDENKPAVSWLAEFTQKPAAVWLFILPTALIQALLRARFPGHHNLSDFFFWMVYFIYGYIFLMDRRFMEAVERSRWTALAIGVACFATILALLGPGGFAQVWEIQPVFSPGFALYQFLRSMNIWAWVLFFLGIGRRRLDVNNRLLQYSIEALLPFYILHHVVIIVLFYLMRAWYPMLLVKYLVLLLGTFLITFVVYEFLVKRFNVLRVIFGMRVKAPNELAQPVE